MNLTRDQLISLLEGKLPDAEGARVIAELRALPESASFGLNAQGNISVTGDGVAIGDHNKIFVFKGNVQEDFVRILREAIEQGQPPPPRDKVSIARLPRLLTPDLFGRERELRMLDEAWANPQINIISFVAWGGVGKSALVSHWLQALERDGWRGAERVFAWSFYSQGTSDKSATAEYFINAALRWFGGDQLADQLQTAGQWEKGERLAQLIRQTRTLLLLDGLEPVQHPPLQADAPEGGLKEQTMQALLRELASHQPGLCVITTRAAVADLTSFAGRSVTQHSLEQLSPQAGAQLLRQLKVNGTQEELEAAAREYGGHSLALTLLGSYLGDLYAGDVRRRHEIESLEDDRKHGGHARKVLRAYETWLGASGRNAILDVLRMLGLFDRPADGAAIAALRAAPAIAGLTDALQPLSEREWQQTLAALRDLRLLAEATPHDPDTLDAHPLVREHFGQQLRDRLPDAWREANNRLYEHLTRTTKEFPDTVEEMSKLHLAVRHGCSANLHKEAWQEIYYARIQQGEKMISRDRLGMLHADLASLANFFEQPWRQLVSTVTQIEKALILRETGRALKALGRLPESVQLLQDSLEICIAESDWENAADTAGSLTRSLLLSGRISEALKQAELGRRLAEQSGSKFQQMSKLSRLAEVLHQLGQTPTLETLFNGALELQKIVRPKCRFLYSIRGLQYCDWLLDQKRYEEVQYQLSFPED